MSNLRDTRRESAARRAFGVRESGVVIERRYTREPSADDVPIGAPRYTRPTYTAAPGKQLYEATAGSGFTSVRASAQEMKYATSVADPAGVTIRQRQGRIRSFFADLASAEAQAEELRKEGLVVEIVPARPYGASDV